jgi:hypothetical protein
MGIHDRISQTEQSNKNAPLQGIPVIINTAQSSVEKNPPAKMEEVSGVV